MPSTCIFVLSRISHSFFFFLCLFISLFQPPRISLLFFFRGLNFPPRRVSTISCLLLCIIAASYAVWKGFFALKTVSDCFAHGARETLSRLLRHKTELNSSSRPLLPPPPPTDIRGSGLGYSLLLFPSFERQRSLVSML